MGSPLICPFPLSCPSRVTRPTDASKAWLIYGEGDERHHVLVDAGPSDTIPALVPELERRIRALPGETDRLELLVVTHVDADHIQGVVPLLSNPWRVPLFRDMWANGFQHLAPDLLGRPDGERLTATLAAYPERRNTRPALLERVRSRTWLVSTDGAVFGVGVRYRVG